MPDTQKRYEWDDGRRMARELIIRHPDVFKGVPALSDILFVMDEESTPKSKGRPIGARVSKIPAKFDDLLEAGDKIFMLEWFKWNTESATRNQRYLLMAHELLHFELDEKTEEHKLRGHDIEEFYLIADRCGLHWADETHGDVPDIMAPDFEWGKEGQARFKLEGEMAELALGLAAAAGVDGTLDAIAAAREADPDWQPPEPLVAKDNVVQFPGTHAANQGS